MMKLRSLHNRASNEDMFAIGVLATVAWAIGGFLLRDDVFIYGDHPGHYWITWYTLNVAAPLHHRLIDWISGWYAGYPELQFTPPGYVLLAFLVNVITWGKLSTALIYEVVVFIGYALPGFTFYYALRHLGFGARVGFLAGLFALVFPAFFDGATALFIGMIGSRLAFGLNALVFAWAVDWLEDRRSQYALAAAFAFAAVILSHPYHAIGIAVALGLYVIVRRLPLFQAFCRLGVIIMCALALDAFWLVPLFAYSSTAMIPVIRSTLDQTWRIMTDSFLLPYALFALIAVGRIWRERISQCAAVRQRSAVLIVLLVAPVSLGAAMLVTHAVLIERLRIYQIDPIRLIGDYFFLIIWIAAIGASEVVDWIARIVGTRGIPAGAVAWICTLVISAPFIVPYVDSAAYYQPRADGEPRFLSQAMSDYRLEEFWQTLSETPGRVLFTSYSTNLNAREENPFPTTLTALTPLFAKRPIVGGTYTAWSPVAAQMWVGQAHPQVLWGLSQDQDDKSLFGSPLTALSDVRLAEICRRLNITAIVASDNDYQTRLFLDSSPLFQSYYNNGFFFVYRPKDAQPAWADAENARVDVVKFEDEYIKLSVQEARAGTIARVKLYAYPLWRAYDESGIEIPVREDDLGLVEITLAPRGDYSITLRYSDGLPAQAGRGISAVSVVSLVTSVAALVTRKRGKCSVRKSDGRS